MNLKEIYCRYGKEAIFLLILLYYVAPFFLIGNLVRVKPAYHLQTFIDNLFPFTPVFILIYFSVYLLVFLPYFIVKEKRHFYKIALTYFLVMSFSYLVFLSFPVELIGPTSGTGIFAGLVHWIYSVDHTTNAFPSLHVSISLLSSLICYNYNKKYSWFILWAIVIAFSTLFVKQHYFLDLVGGWLVGIAGYLLLTKILRN